MLVKQMEKFLKRQGFTVIDTNELNELKKETIENNKPLEQKKVISPKELVDNSYFGKNANKTLEDATEYINTEFNNGNTYPFLSFEEYPREIGKQLENLGYTVVYYLTSIRVDLAKEYTKLLGK